ncbi:MAG TPA: LamG domain-containing protein, partial [Actinomycetota bacterium]|nr:LamG domain-containing protein [Actinomycetota bacterium]
MRHATGAGVAAGLALAALLALPAAAAESTLELKAGGYPVPYLSVPIDASMPGPAIDVGAGDFTVELFLRASPGANTVEACDLTPQWHLGSVLIDRSRAADQGRRGFGLALSRDRLVFGVTGPDGEHASVCGSRRIADGAWHHVAAQRRAADGRITIWVDGALDASATGPSGDVSYPDGATYPFGCNCSQDPYLFIGAKEHHSAPSFVGRVDELRISSALRYAGPFTRPARAFTPDAKTAALYHFDEGSGSVARDATGRLDATFGTWT